MTFPAQHAGAPDDVDHVLLTRFNLPSVGAESYIRAAEGWLRERVELFERFCLPSVQNQTMTDRLAWLVYLDPESPAWLKARVSEWAGRSPMTPIYRAEVPRQALVADLRRVSGGDGRMLVTTNLDNDDGLAADFSARVRVAVGTGLDTGPSAVYVDRGLILGNARTYLRRDTVNAFCSVAESWDDPVTCWSAWHNELGRLMPEIHVDGPPGWLQVIHGRNVSNRVRGRLTSPAVHSDRFPGLIDDLDDPSAWTRLQELLLEPARQVREVMRRAVKRVLLAMGGPAALERVHALRNGLRHRAAAQLHEPETGQRPPQT